MQPSINFKISGEGIPFIFQHGLGSNLAQPQGLLGKLENLQLISMDCPGHGDAPLRLGNQPSFDFYADEIVRLMAYLNIEKAIFGGISMGAGISMNIALRYPEKVMGLVLVRPAWLAKGNPQNLLILKEAAKFIGKRNGTTDFEQNADYRAIKNNLPNAAASIMGVFANTQQATIPIVLKKMVANKPFKKIQELSKIIQPCLILGNEDDPLHPFGKAEIIHQNIKESQLIKVVSRYFNNEQHKMMVNKTIDNFIKKFFFNENLCSTD